MRKCPEDNSVRLFLSHWCLSAQLLESARFRHRFNRHIEFGHRLTRPEFARQSAEHRFEIAASRTCDSTA